MRQAKVGRRRGIAVVASCVAAVGAFGAASASAATPTVTVAEQGVAIENPHPHIAQQRGYFKKMGVNVKILENTGASSVNLLVAKQADLVTGGMGTPLTLNAQGRPTTIIFSNLSNGVAASVIAVDKNITRMSQLARKRIAVLPKGTSTFGSAAFFNAKFKLFANLIPLADYPTQIAAVSSGQVDAAIGVASVFDPLVKAGKAHFILDMRKTKQRRDTLGQDYPEVGYYGIKADVQAKRDAITRFMAAVQMANTWMKKATNSQVASVLRTFPVFQTTPKPTMIQQLPGARAFWTATPPGDGTFNAKQWGVTLRHLSRWGLTGFSPAQETDPRFSYRNQVDMSYMRAAKKLVDKANKK